MPERHGDPKAKWAVARDPHNDSLGLVVFSWHRWYWQAFRRQERVNRLSAVEPGTYYVTSRDEVDRTWDIAEQRMELQRDLTKSRAGWNRAKALLARGGSQDLDGRV